MQRSSTVAITLLAAGILLQGSAPAQQTPGTNPQTAPPAKPQTTAAAKSSATKSQTAPSTKPRTATHPTTAARKPAPLVLTTQKDKASYAIGLNIGKGLHRDSVEIDPKVFLRGVEDAMAGGKTLLTDDEMKATMMALQTDLRKKQGEKMQALAVTNKKEGDAFLAANKTKPGVITLPSGLQYKVLTEGTGPKPTASDTVVCNYRGMLLDNTEFDSSYKRGQPATFSVGQVIKGWTEALQQMPTGSKWQLVIPSDLAYGEHGREPVIGPNATLVFEVELLSIQSKSDNGGGAAAPSSAAPKTAAPGTAAPGSSGPNH
jgi:FKBP-type peptidyl-prolyl cis-trans isomerase FklB